MLVLLICFCSEQVEVEDLRIDNKSLFEGANPLYDALSRKDLDPDKLAYIKPIQGYAEPAVSSPEVVETISSTHCT